MRALKLISCFLFTCLSINIYAAKTDGAIGGGLANPAGFRNTIRLDRLDAEKARFKLLSGSTWEGVGLHSSICGPHKTEIFKMAGGRGNAGFGRTWVNNKGNNRLEGEFDLSFSGLFDLADGRNIVSYLAKNCVGDKAMVHTEVSAVPVSAEVSIVPVPAAVWLFSSALLGFIGFSKKRTVG